MLMVRYGYFIGDVPIEDVSQHVIAADSEVKNFPPYGINKYCKVGIRIAANDPAEMFPLTILQPLWLERHWIRPGSKLRQSLPLARRMLWALLPKLPPGLQL
ncbi:hypothetical protein ACLKA6_009726 [Drosophila palustris]